VTHELDVRASDAERERVVARLGEACAEGRISVDELGERIDAAYGALTRRELDALLADLPGAPRRAPPKQRRPYMPGIRSFRERFVATAPRRRVVDSALVALAPQLEARGYRLVAQDDAALVFQRDYRPVWTVMVAAVVFPVGLLALLHHPQSRLQVSFAETERGVEVTASGSAPLPLRRAFFELRDAPAQSD
jgi:hypothetical protein